MTKETTSSTNVSPNPLNFYPLGLIRKNREDDKRSRILVKELIKNDDNLEQHFQSFRQKKIDDRLKQIFNVEDPQSIQSEDLGLFCNQISKRFYLFKNSIPSSLACVLYGVINHDNLLENDRMVTSTFLNKIAIGELTKRIRLRCQQFLWK